MTCLRLSNDVPEPVIMPLEVIATLGDFSFGIITLLIPLPSVWKSSVITLNKS
jgi:hypothetical protein